MTRRNFVVAVVTAIILYTLIHYIYVLINPEVTERRLETFLIRAGITIIFGVSLTVVILKRLKHLHLPVTLALVIWPAVLSAFLFDWFLFFPNGYVKTVYSTPVYSIASLISYAGAVGFIAYLTWKK